MTVPVPDDFSRTGVRLICTCHEISGLIIWTIDSQVDERARATIQFRGIDAEVLLSGKSACIQPEPDFFGPEELSVGRELHASS
jgi:hypothetical protein